MRFLTREEKDGKASYSVLPDEEIEVSAVAPGSKAEPIHVQLKDGEVREITLDPTVAR